MICKIAWKEKTEQLKTELYALYLAYKDPRVPWYAKILIVIIVGYFVNPIELIPDFIPFIGYLDDLVILLIGIYLLRKMIPKDIMSECRDKARTKLNNGMGKKWVVTLIIVIIWLLLLVLILRFIFKITF